MLERKQSWVGKMQCCSETLQALEEVPEAHDRLHMRPHDSVIPGSRSCQVMPSSCVALSWAFLCNSMFGLVPRISVRRYRMLHEYSRH